MADQTSSEVTQQRLADINAATLMPLVQSALNSPDAVVTWWSSSQLQGGSGGGTLGTAIYRFEGEIQDRGKTQAWSLILKVLYLKDDQQLTDSHYWKREVHAYQSDWLTHLSGTLVAPRCFGVVEYPEACWLWLEEVVDASPSQWTIEHYGTAARHLGEFSGAYLIGTSLPDWTWLSVQWIRQDTAKFSSWLSQLPAALEHPLVRRLLPDSSVDKILRLWEDRETFLTILERLPQTLCHFDAFRRNLFTRSPSAAQEQTVAIDWAFAGIGPIGAELVSLVWVGLVFDEVRHEPVYELDQQVFENYVTGLRAAGWTGDPLQARLGYTAAAGLRRISTIGVDILMIQQGTLTDTDIPELDRTAAHGLFIEQLTDEARTLIRTLKIT